MKNVLYLGNALSRKGKTKTSVETLGLLLGDMCHIKTASRKSNKILRLLDMLMLVFRNRNKTDVILIDTYSTLNFYYAYAIGVFARVLKIKYIPILHGGNLEHRLKQSPKMSRTLFHNAYCCVAPSLFLKSVFETYGYKNIEFIPNSITLLDYEFMQREIISIRLFWLRSFSRIYNPKMAVLVLSRLIELGYEAELVMVGPKIDDSLNEVKHISQAKNLKVTYTGILTKQEWIELSKSSNIFINTSNYDNMPVSVIEAMALGLPVVSTNVGGLPYLIKHKEDGFLVGRNAIEEMVESIIELKTNNTLRLRCIINARTKVEKFDWEIVKLKWEGLLC